MVDISKKDILKGSQVKVLHGSATVNEDESRKTTE